MKKNLLATLTLMAISGGAFAADGTVTFVGTISSAACSVSTVAGDAGTTSEVDFGKVSATSLNTAGKATSGTDFNITLTDCAIATAPHIRFTGTAVTTANYTNLFESGIAGIGIRIQDAGNNTIYTNNTSAANTGFAAITGAAVPSATGNFRAHLVAYATTTADNIANITGPINQNINFEIAYR